MGKDTHALSGPAERTAVELLAANSVETVMQSDDGFTPTPVISRAILVYNRAHRQHAADGIVVTPSHNQPEAMLNAYWEPLTFELPSTGQQDNRRWRRWIDTFLPSPEDICAWEDAPIVSQSTYVVEPRSLVLLVDTAL